MSEYEGIIEGLHADLPGNSRSALYDPRLPILDGPGGVMAASRRNQRLRRAKILATVRRLLTEEGFDAVTVRRIATASGHAVQTVYNLVGPRGHVVVEAISEYTRYVGRTAAPRHEDPYAVVEIIDRWMQSVEAAPDFCRNVCQIYFSRSRHIFYDFRDRELQSLHRLLRGQQKSGALRPEVNTRDLAEELMYLSCGVCIEWSDRPFPVEQVRRRLYSAFTNLLTAAIAPSAIYRQQHSANKLREYQN